MQYEMIRKQTVCPNCGHPKNIGLVLCWTCNGVQKERNDGDYSPRLKSKLAHLDAELRGSA